MPFLTKDGETKFFHPIDAKDAFPQGWRPQKASSNPAPAPAPTEAAIVVDEDLGGSIGGGAPATATDAPPEADGTDIAGAGETAPLGPPSGDDGPVDPPADAPTSARPTAKVVKPAAKK